MTRLGGLLPEYGRAAAWPKDGCSAASSVLRKHAPPSPTRQWRCFWGGSWRPTLAAP